MVEENVICIWNDLHNEKSGYFRAFWCNNPNGDVGCPVIGYCSDGGSQRTIRATVREVRKFYPKALIYRNGKQIL